MLNNNHLTEEQLAICAEAINNKSYDSLPKHIRKHIADCSDCANELMIISDISLEVEGDLALEKKTKYIKLNPWYIGIGSVAAAILIIFIAIEFSNLNKESINENQISDIPAIIDEDLQDHIKKTEKDQQAIQKDTNIIEDTTSHTVVRNDFDKKSLAYVPEITLEHLFQNMKGEYRSESVEIKTPHTLQINKSAKDTLRWLNPKNEILFVEIFNNKAEEVLVTETDSESIITPELKEGLYYWKLINKDFDLLFVGKIIVE
ncbi:MAG: hypothetical protein ACOCWC_04175 [Bacteroidota bacterium]